MRKQRFFYFFFLTLQIETAYHGILHAQAAIIQCHTSLSRYKPEPSGKEEAGHSGNEKEKKNI